MSETSNVLRPTVSSVIAALFSPDERTTIAEIIVEECNAERLHSSSPERLERIQLAILKLSNGEVDRFLAAAELARLDWRDVLVAAGFGNDLNAHLEWADNILGKSAS